MKVLKAKNMGYAVIPAKNEGTVGSHLELFFFQIGGGHFWRNPS